MVDGSFKYIMFLDLHEITVNLDGAKLASIDNNITQKDAGEKLLQSHNALIKEQFVQISLLIIVCVK